MTREEEISFEDTLKKNGLVCKAKTLANKYRKIGVILYVNISIISSRLPIKGEQLKQLEKIQNLQQLPSTKNLLENIQLNEEEIIFIQTIPEKETLTELPTSSVPKGLGMAVLRTLVILIAIIAFIYLFFL